MDPTEYEIELSCAPVWAHPENKARSNNLNNDIPWRDHWMQAVYYPISSTKCRAGQEVSLVSNHDEYSLWFDVVPVGSSESNKIQQIPMPSPSPGIHLAVSRTRLGQINDPERNQKLVEIANMAVEKADNLRIFVLSEQSLLPLITAKILKNRGRSGKVVSVELNHQMRQVSYKL